MDWGREAVTRAYAVAASSYADAFAAAGFVDGAAMTRPPRPDEHQVEKLFVSAACP